MPKYFLERGRSHEEVINRIHSKYGQNAKILFRKTVPSRGFLGLLGREAVEYTGYVAIGREAREEEVLRDKENKAAILEAAGKNSSSPGSLQKKKEEELGDVLEELRDIKTRLSLGASPPPDPFPTVGELREILKENEFEEEYVDKLVQFLRKELSAEDFENPALLQQAAAHYIADTLTFWKAPSRRHPRIFILVGPTGVGKTTTIAKLAAVYGLPSEKGTGEVEDVRIITVDSFRIGARAQVETYGSIMGIPVSSADNHQELRKQIALAGDSDLILVDTIGKSPRDFMKLAEMRQLLEACGENAEVHLAMSATTKIADMREILKQFEPFGYVSLLFTKLDETTRIGSIISLAASEGRSLSFLTNGQSVPMDIETSSPQSFLSRLKGLKYDPKQIEQRYPAVSLTASWR